MIYRHDPIDPKGRLAPGARRLEQKLIVVLDRYDAFVAKHGDHPPRGWLMRFRPLVRELLEHREWRSLHLGYLALRGDDRLRPVWVWLYGRHAGAKNVARLEMLGRNNDPAVRKQAAKALRRLGAQAELDRLVARWHDDEWILRYQRLRSSPDRPLAYTRRGFENRLQSYVERNVDASAARQAAGPSRMPLWARDRYWFLSPPKSAAAIRRLLMRIHRWAAQRSY